MPFEALSRSAWSDEQYAFPQGELRAGAGSNAEGLLSALARAHYGTRRTKGTARVEAVSFATAILGRELTRGRGSVP